MKKVYIVFVLYMFLSVSYAARNLSFQTSEGVTTVNLAAGTQVNIGNQPTVNLSTGTTITVNLASNSQVNIGNSPTVNLATDTQIRINDNQSTAFGEIQVAELTPVFQKTFVYGDGTEHWNSTTTNVLATLTLTRSMIRLSTGATANSQYHLISRIPIKYSAGQGGLARMTAMVHGATINSDVEWGLGDERDGFSFKVSDNVFGINRRVASVDYFTPQSQFSDDKLDGTGSSGMIIDITKLNVYQIQFQYLGAGQVKFSVEDPNTGKFMTVHRIKYANQNTFPSIEQPTLPLHFDVENESNNADVSLYSASVAGFIEGKDAELGTIFGTNITDAVTTEEAILSIKNVQIFNGVVNKNRIKLTSVNLATDGTKSAIFRIYRRATTTGGSFVNISTANSIASIDSTGAHSSGTLVTAIVLAKVESRTLDLESYGIYINPNEILTITGQSAASNDTDVSLTWKEIF